MLALDAPDEEAGKLHRPVCAVSVDDHRQVRLAMGHRLRLPFGWQESRDVGNLEKGSLSRNAVWLTASIALVFVIVIATAVSLVVPIYLQVQHDGCEGLAWVTHPGLRGRVPSAAHANKVDAVLTPDFETMQTGDVVDWSTERSIGELALPADYRDVCHRIQQLCQGNRRARLPSAVSHVPLALASGREGVAVERNKVNDLRVMHEFV